MYELIQFDWQNADNPHLSYLPLFIELVPPKFQTYLQGKDPNNISDTTIIAIGCVQNNHPLGILLATCYRHTHQVKLHYISAPKPLAKQLLEKLDFEAKKIEGRHFIYTYKKENPSTPELENTLQASGWKIDHPYMITCLYDGFKFDPPWIHIPYKLPNTMEIFQWSELTTSERQQIFDDERRGIIPYHVLPFRKESQIEPLNSLGLRYEGRVIGWIITLREGSDKIIYHALYIDRSYHFMGPGVKLLIDSMLLQKKSSVKWAEFRLPLTQVSPAWIQFINRRLIPYADEVVHYMQAWK